MDRAFHYGGRHSARDSEGIIHVTWEDPTYEFHYYSHSLDTIGLTWTEPINPYKATDFTVDRALMAKMAINPVTNDVYLLSFHRVNPGEDYHTGITRSTDGGATFETYLDLNIPLGRLDEEVSWGTFAIGTDQVMHITYARANRDMMYTRTDLTDNTDLTALTFTRADGVTAGDEAISFVPSGVVFQGTIVLDRNGDPHIIFSGDGDPDFFGDKTPYHIYYKSADAAWGPIPPQKLQAELEQTWGMPEMVFDANNRGYYFFIDRGTDGMKFGTWEPPAGANAFGSLNNTGDERGDDAALDMITDNFANLDITPDDAPYLPNADVDDV
ncbi:MAG: hypothetical protein KAU50_04690, partial [Candidatus Marinimicrobia bacterium]|nr:hypothetical protein [Candidatus Neomarinimicrobiota bacterium]